MQCTDKIARQNCEMYYMHNDDLTNFYTLFTVTAF